MRKVFTIRILSFAITIALTSALQFLPANAQTESFIPADMRWISSTQYTNTDTPKDSIVMLWTKDGYPAGIKEAYDRISNRWVLSQSGKLISDTGRDFTWEHTTHPENVGGDKVTIRYTYKLDQWGAPLLTQMPVDMGGVSMTMETTYQYWRNSKNWVDSCLVTSSMFGMTMSKVRFKYTFGADGLLSTTEIFYETAGVTPNYSKFIATYFKNASGKLERQVEEKYHYSGGSGGTLHSSTKSVIWYDSKERMYREDVYSAISAEKYDNYTITYYSGSSSNIPDITPTAQVSIFASSDILLVNSSMTEVISIFSINGTQVYTNLITAGETRISIQNLPQGVYIVQGSSGWVRKIVKP